MVNEGDELIKSMDRKKRKEELESRIRSTHTGYEWIRRINRIGKNDSEDFEDVRKERDGEDTTSSE